MGTDEFSNCLLFGRARALLGKLGLKATGHNGPVDGDAGLLGFDEDSALVQHRHFDREADPPRV